MVASRTSLMLAFASLASVGAACGGDAVDPIATYPYPPDGMFDQAGTGGTLVREGNCLYMELEGTYRYFLAFPAGVAFWDDGRLIVDGVPFREGDTVRFGGGEGWDDAMVWEKAADNSCDLTDVWRASGPL